MKTLTPQLFLSMKQYTKEQFTKDVISGIIVAIIAPAPVHSPGAGLRCDTGTGTLHGHHSRVCYFLLRR